jgi:hypothetical protein
VHQTPHQGMGGFISWGIEPVPGWPTVSTNNAAFPTANQLRCTQFTLTKRVKIDQIQAVVGSTVVASTHIVVFIYSRDKSTLLLKGWFDSSAAGLKTGTITTGSGVVLQPGVYWFCYTCDNNTITASVITGAGASGFFNSALSNHARQGLAANTMTLFSDATPATLGVITASSFSPVACLFEKS